MYKLSDPYITVYASSTICFFPMVPFPEDEDDRNNGGEAKTETQDQSKRLRQLLLGRPSLCEGSLRSASACTCTCRCLNINSKRGGRWQRWGWQERRRRA